MSPAASSPRKHQADANGTNERATKRSKIEKLDNLHVTNIRPLIPPACVLEEFPVTPEVYATVADTREAISNILHGKDDRLVSFFSRDSSMTPCLYKQTYIHTCRLLSLDLARFMILNLLWNTVPLTYEYNI
jgi:hypothetical protein